MFASMRRYRMQSGSVPEFMRRVDESFADQIAAQPGFVSYELIDCAGGDLFTLSIFLEPGQAVASRELARGWTEEHLRDIDHQRFDSIQGESVVSRAAPGMLEAGHVGSARKSVSIRLYLLRGGTNTSFLERVDHVLADRLQELDGFEAAHLLDCGEDGVLWISFLRDQSSLEDSDAQAVAFVRDELAKFRPERVVTIRGEVVVSRANAELLEPAHA
jgi:hypothetical protein